jgi:hypothetical protein
LHKKNQACDILVCMSNMPTYQVQIRIKQSQVPVSLKNDGILPQKKIDIFLWTHQIISFHFYVNKLSQQKRIHFILKHPIIPSLILKQSN